jgi:hypothetical protein
MLEEQRVFIDRSQQALRVRKHGRAFVAIRTTQCSAVAERFDEATCEPLAFIHIDPGTSRAALLVREFRLV